MFDSSIYSARREALARGLKGVLLIPGNGEAAMNFRANAYDFRQDGSFRYFFGLDRPDLFGAVDADTGQALVFGDDAGIDGAIWSGPQPGLMEQARSVGVEDARPLSELGAWIASAWRSARPIHYPPPYRADTIMLLAQLLDRPHTDIHAGASADLVRAIVALREIKSTLEVEAIERALEVTRIMHHEAMAVTKPGVREHAVVGRVEGIARSANMRLAYQPIFSGRGEVLHNLRYNRTLAAGELVVHDSGAAGMGYASDITRTIPVSGRFDAMQRRLYDAVVSAQRAAIAGMRPGVPFRDLHFRAAVVLVEALSEVGVFRGDPAEIVESGAYAIVFQTGLGHALGLDVHDMEALGEDLVGYDAGHVRSALFGLRNLRLAKPLRDGMVVTVEPGLYFIPDLIDRWRDEARHGHLIDYDRLDRFRSFGGIRVEDDVLVTATAARVLGPSIARSAEEVEAMTGSGDAALAWV